MSESQTTANVLMIRPASFELNSQTAVTNAFQHSSNSISEPTQTAQREFDLLVGALRSSGVSVHEYADTPSPSKPDALFPNNWVSFHSDGNAVLYPMLAPNRRAERRIDILEALKTNYSIRSVIDLSNHEESDRYLEGTGSMVLDRTNRVAYAALSPRTHLSVLSEFAEQLGYKAIAFRACDDDRVPIYHTNVLMSLGSRFAIVCTESISPENRLNVLNSIARTGRELIEISQKQMANFAGNILELETESGTSIVAMSDRAKDAFTSEQLKRLEYLAGPIVSSPIPTIEELGGGSVRCMLAEIHLPRRSK